MCIFLLGLGLHICLKFYIWSNISTLSFILIFLFCKIVKITNKMFTCLNIFYYIIVICILLLFHWKNVSGSLFVMLSQHCLKKFWNIFLLQFIKICIFLCVTGRTTFKYDQFFDRVLLRNQIVSRWELSVFVFFRYVFIVTIE